MKQKSLTPTRVLVAMSGGVDSSVAAMLMKKKGYEVIGTFMKNWSESKNGLGECNWIEERKMAIKVASLLKIPLITLDFEKEYRRDVVEKMYRDYLSGITPNPDIDCNQKMKFPLLIKEAKNLGADFVVTGHYARIKRFKNINKNIRSTTFRSQIDDITNNKSAEKLSNIKNKKISADAVSRILPKHMANRNANASEQQLSYELLRAKDETKDQSYFLYRIKQNELKYLKFPIGDYTKKQVREIARKNKFPNFDKKSTVGICFIGKVNLKKFLQKKIKPKVGRILDPKKSVIGEHDGIYYYTIGQRIGPRYGIKFLKKGDDKKTLKKWYVARKNPKKNELVLAPEGHELLYRREIYLNKPHWINNREFRKLFDEKSVNSKSKPIFNKIKKKTISVNSKKISADVVSSILPKRMANRNANASEQQIKVHSRIRQAGELLPSKISYDKKKNKIKVTLNKAITGVSEGQAIVLYQGKKVLGGGEIRFK